MILRPSLEGLIFLLEEAMDVYGDYYHDGLYIGFYKKPSLEFKAKVFLYAIRWGATTQWRKKRKGKDILWGAMSIPYQADFMLRKRSYQFEEILLMRFSRGAQISYVRECLEKLLESL